MIGIKDFEDLWEKSIRGLCIEAIAGGEIERNENLDSSLEVMSSMETESNPSYILVKFHRLWIWQFCVLIRFPVYILHFRS